MGKVMFGCEIQNKKFIPTITFQASGVKDIVFTANCYCKDNDQARDFCRKIFKILNGAKENVRFSPGEAKF